MAVDPFVQGRVYAGTNLGVFTSTDSGADWTMSLSSPYIWTFAVEPVIQAVTPQAGLQDLAGDVETLASPGGPLNSGQENALLQKLQNALDALNNKKNKKLACNQLGAFLNQVSAFVPVGEHHRRRGRDAHHDGPVDHAVGSLQLTGQPQPTPPRLSPENVLE